MGFPGDSDGKEPACNAEDLGLIPELGRSPGEGYGNPLHYAGLEKPHGWRSLAGYSPWGYKESDTTEHARTHTHTYICVCINIFISEKAMAPHSSTLSWRIPWTEDPGRLQSMRSLRVRYD